MESYTVSEVSKNDGRNHVYWIIIDSYVYDITSYILLNNHPGGEEVLIMYAGKDATKSFKDIHSKDAYNELNQFFIGRLENTSMFYTILKYLKHFFNKMSQI